MKYLSKFLFVMSLLFIGTLVSCSEDDDNNTACDSGLTCAGTVASDETAATVPSGLVGNYATTYQYEEPNSPFTNGTSATFEITANNELIVSISGHDCITLSNPVFRYGANNGNYFFKDDCLHNVAFNVSENTDGTFAEVNVQPLTGPGFFGQFQKN